MRMAVGLAMGSDGAITYSDAMSMSCYELSVAISAVEEIIERRNREMKRVGRSR